MIWIESVLVRHLVCQLILTIFVYFFVLGEARTLVVVINSLTIIHLTFSLNMNWMLVSILNLFFGIEL